MQQPRTRVRRHAERGSYDRAVIDAILDEALIAHVGFVADGAPVVIPTAFVRLGDRIFLHGSNSNHMLRTIAAGDACVTVTLLDGLVLAKTAFHHSVNYRSVVIFGRGAIVDDAAEKRRALAALIDRMAPSRSRDCRPPDDRELAATLVVSLSTDEASAKIRTGPPLPEAAADARLPYPTGVIPLVTTRGPLS